MPDLTTTHLKRLLDQATPGPWEYEGSQFQEITTLDQDGLEQAVISLDRYTEKETCNRPADMNLAAHAPQLAEDLIHQLDALVYLIEEVISAAENTNDVETTKHITEAIKTTIEKIKGDHDE